jgi:homopolymeric O-antigen transport system ATP-binding protein
MSSEVAIKVEGLFKSYRMYDSPAKRFFQQFLGESRKLYTTADVLKDINFEIYKGETVGIVGANGAGKSTLLSIIAGVLGHEKGSVFVDGKVSALLSLGTGFIADFSGRENVFLNATLLGLKQQEIEDRLDQILAFADIGAYIDQPVRTYSSGMYARLAFAVAIHTEPQILIIDETLSVGDEAFQRKCFAKIDNLKSQGVTILFVSHSAGAVLELCDRAILLANGKRHLMSTPKTVISYYQKLIYSAADRRKKILSEMAIIDAGGEVESDDTQRTNTAMAKTIWKERFDEKLKPLSTMSYLHQGAEIFDVRITTEDNEQVNILNSDGEYYYHYNVRFDTHANGARFAMLLKTVSGQEFGALWTAPRGEGIDVEPGDIVNVRFPVKIPLREGVYFGNAGAWAVVDGEYTLVHRIIDATAFRVMPQSHGVGDRYINISTPEAATAMIAK